MEEVEKLNRVIASLKMVEPEPELLDFASCDDDTYRCLANIGTLLCTKMIPGDSSFYLLDSPKKQATVIHNLSVVVVFKGMLSFIFRAASLVAAATPCPTPAPAGTVTPWAENLGHWLEEGPFFFDDERFWWLQSPDHRVVFDFFVDNLFRFVVLHEIGHLHNMHSSRRETLLNEELLSGTNTTDVAVEDLSVHLREIIADTYAFQFFLQELIEILAEDDAHTNSQKDVAIALKSASFVTALYTIQLYFWLSAAIPSARASFALNSKKYPPHAFRMQAIESTALEHINRILPSALANKSLAQAMGKTQTISQNVAGTEDFIKWRIKLNDPAFLEHYEKICQGSPNWANRVFGVHD